MADCRFEKCFRLLSAKDFAELKVGSSSYKKASLIVYYKKNSLDKSRIGIATPRKVGKSHDRNRLKRIIRDYFRTSSYKFLSTDILFVVSWSKSLMAETSDAREPILRKNLREFFHFLADEKLRAKK